MNPRRGNKIQISWHVILDSHPLPHMRKVGNSASTHSLAVFPHKHPLKRSDPGKVSHPPGSLAFGKDAVSYFLFVF